MGLLPKHKHRRKKLGLIVLLILGVGTAVGMVTMALKENINLFFSPSQIIAGEAPQGIPSAWAAWCVPVRSNAAIPTWKSFLKSLILPRVYRSLIRVSCQTCSVKVRVLLPRASSAPMVLSWLARCWPSTMKTICHPRPPRPSRTPRK